MIPRPRWDSDPTYGGCDGPCEECGRHAHRARERDDSLICDTCLGLTCPCGGDMLVSGACETCGRQREAA